MSAPLQDMVQHNIAREPTLEEVEGLPEGDCFLYNNRVWVKGLLSGNSIVVICPFCQDKKGQRLSHRHGSEGRTDTRWFTTRSPHCIRTNNDNTPEFMIGVF